MSLSGIEVGSPSPQPFRKAVPQQRYQLTSHKAILADPSILAQGLSCRSHPDTCSVHITSLLEVLCEPSPAVLSRTSQHSALISRQSADVDSNEGALEAIRSFPLDGVQNPKGGGVEGEHYRYVNVDRY